MVAYHGDPTVKADVLARLAVHAAADEIVQGVYWQDGRGCAVGCLTHDPDGGHHLFPELFGLPPGFAWLIDAVFEGLRPAEAKNWGVRVMSAVPVGAVVDDAWFDRLAVARLTGLLDLAPSWPDGVRDQTVAAVRGVIDALEGRGDRETALSAAWSAALSAAWSAAWSAALSAAWSAERSAEGAAEGAAARSAARSAEGAAARSAAWEAEADRIITALGTLAAR